MARKIQNETVLQTRHEVTITDELASNAVGAFLKYFEMKKESRQKKSLFDENETISVEITLSKLCKSNKLKLHRIALPHPMEENPDPICLIVKSGFRNELKESLLNQTGIELIVTMDELPKEYKQFEDRRKLHNSYNKFICDENVQAFLPKILGVGGSHWRKPIYPITISQNISEDALLAKIETVRASTYWHFSEGANISIKFGNTSMTKQQLVENLVHVVPEVMSRIPQGWDSIARVGIKSPGSIYFPLYFAPPPAPLESEETKKKEKTPKPEKQQEVEQKQVEDGKKKKRFFEKEEAAPVESAKKAKTQSPAKQQKVVQKEEEEEPEAEEEEQEPEDEEEEVHTPAKKQKQTTPVKKVTPISKKDLLKNKVKSLSAKKATNGSSKPKVRKTQTP